MRSGVKGQNWLVFALALVLVLAVSAIFLAVSGLDEGNIEAALRMSAYLAFIVLALIFLLRPLVELRPNRAMRTLLKNRRLLGVAFAGIHTAHLLLISLRDYFDAGFDLFLVERLPGAGVYAMIYLMFITSFEGPARALGPRRWRALHKAGLYVVFTGFLVALIPPALAKPASAHGLLSGLAAIAVLLRMAAYLRRHPRIRAKAGRATRQAPRGLLQSNWRDNRRSRS